MAEPKGTDRPGDDSTAIRRDIGGTRRELSKQGPVTPSNVASSARITRKIVRPAKQGTLKRIHLLRDELTTVKGKSLPKGI